MIVFITGGAKNGKSSFAQSLAVKLAAGGRRYYIATMIPVDDEDRERIRRHIADREGLGFETVEQGKNILECLKTCDPAKVPYCITHALIEAVKGNVEEGLFFCGANVGRLSRMYTVRELMDELVTEWRQNL